MGKRYSHNFPFLLAICIVAACVCHPSMVFSQSLSFTGQAQGTKSEDLGIEVTNDLITMDVQSADMALILAEIAEKTNIAFDIAGDVHGKVSIRLKDATIEDVLRRLGENRAIVYEYMPKEKAYRIVNAAFYERSRAKTGSGSRDLETPRRTSRKNAGSQVKRPGSGGEGRGAPHGSSPDSGTAGAGETTDRMVDDLGRPLYKPGEVLVTFKAGTTEEQIRRLHEVLGSTVLTTKDRRLKMQRIRLRKGLSEQEAIERYEASGLVEFAERHPLRYLNKTPDDIYYGAQWALPRIEAPEAWDITEGSREVVIAVIDSGVDYLHPDLSENIWVNEQELNGTEGFDDDGNTFVDDIYGWDFAGPDQDDPGDGDSNPIDVDGHGTHVAGTIAAVGNNGIGVAGVCWKVKIMVLKVEAENSDFIEDDDVIDALHYAVDMGAHIVNCSFGGGSYGSSEVAAFEELRDAGILAVCAAGNSSEDSDEPGNENYPSGYNLENIVSVAASGQTDNLATFSNWGAESVDLMAPGVEIRSTIPPVIYTEAQVIAEMAENPVEYSANGMTYAGTTDEDGITALAYDCGYGNAPAEFPTAVDGNIAIIKRDRVVFFSEKTTNAQNAGAVAVILYNNTTEEEPDNTVNFLGTLGAPGPWVPVVSLSNIDGETIIGGGLPRSVTVVNAPLDAPSSYGVKDGTSMATPHVSGVAGLLLSVNPGLNDRQVKSVILDTVDPIESVFDKMVSGGRVNARSAVSHAFLPGDISGDNSLQLDDALLGLKVISGLMPEIPVSCISWGVDVNGDDKIGMEEVNYIMREVSGP